MINLHKLQRSWNSRVRSTGIKKKTLAANIGITPMHLSRLLNNSTYPSVDSIHAIEKELDRLGQPFKLEYILDE